MALAFSAPLVPQPAPFIFIFNLSDETLRVTLVIAPSICSHLKAFSRRKVALSRLKFSACELFFVFIVFIFAVSLHDWASSQITLPILVDSFYFFSPHNAAVLRQHRVQHRGGNPLPPTTTTTTSPL